MLGFNLRRSRRLTFEVDIGGKMSVEVPDRGYPSRYRLPARARRRTLRETRPQPGTLLCLWSLLPNPRRPARSLQGTLQSRRYSLRALGIRRRRAVRSDREEAVFSRLPRCAGL